MTATVNEALYGLAGWGDLYAAIIIQAITDYLHGYAYMYKKFKNHIPSSTFYYRYCKQPRRTSEKQKVTWYYTALRILDDDLTVSTYSDIALNTIYNYITEKEYKIAIAIDKGKKYAHLCAITRKKLDNEKGDYIYE